MYMVRTGVGCKVTELYLGEIGYESVYYIKLWLLRKGALMCGGSLQHGKFISQLSD